VPRRSSVDDGSDPSGCRFPERTQENRRKESFWLKVPRLKGSGRMRPARPRFRNVRGTIRKEFGDARETRTWTLVARPRTIDREKDLEKVPHEAIGVEIASENARFTRKHELLEV